MVDSQDDSTTPLPVTAPLRLRFASDQRVYVAELGVDLLGDWVVTQMWGGKSDRRGGGKTIAVPDPEAGLALLERVAARRAKRGYRRIETASQLPSASLP
jgi:hypothetical protein